VWNVVYLSKLLVCSCKFCADIGAWLFDYCVESFFGIVVGFLLNS